MRGKVCVLTGASSGIGRRTALDLARDGAIVCVVARRRELLETLVGEMGGEPHSYFVCDVSDVDAVRALVQHVEERHGRCDVLINNAGFSRPAPFAGEGSLADLHDIMDTNFYGTVNCTALFLPLLERSSGHVVVVASMAGRLAFPGSPSYVASKWAVVGWAESAAFDLRKRKIGMSIVEPGPIPTEGFPQETLVGHPVFRYALGSQADVSRAIRTSVTKNRAERVVPRWYYLLQLPRIIAPPLYRYLAERLARPHV